MRRLLLTLPALLVLSLLLPSTSFGLDEIRHTIRFEPSQVTMEYTDGFDIAAVEDCPFQRIPGEPLVPVRTVQFALPAGAEAVELELLSIDQVELETNVHLYPAQPPVHLSSQELPAFTPPDPAVYGSAAPYPAVAARLVGTGNLGGYAVAAIEVYPLQYRPDERRLFLNRSVEVALRFETAGTAPAIAARSELAERAVSERVASLVINPERVPEAVALESPGKRQETVDYAIITATGLMDDFQPLADWKTKKGVRAEVFDVDWIYANYTGVDSVEQVRNFIKDYQANHGLVYVLLGGGVFKVPARTAWDDLGYDGIKADLYFSDVDGNWNADNDAFWGEHPADNVDMYGDVYVGRAVVSNGTGASNFVNNILTYEGASTGNPLPTDFQEDMFFMAEVLWSNPYSDGGVMKDMIDDESVPSTFDPITKLYQDDGNLNYASAMAAMNAGPGITNHAGHCNVDVMSIGPSALYNDDMDALVNGDRQGILYTGGCWPAAIDMGCIAKHYVNNPDGGGVAFIGNSRYGWGCPGAPGLCASDLYDRQFFQSLFVRDFVNLGITHADHKDHYVPSAKSDAYMRYCLYELNVVGDPEMPIWTENPGAFSVAHPATAPAGSSSFAVTVSEAKAPVEDARVCLWKGTEVYEVDWTDGGGQAVFTIDPATAGAMSVTVTKHNFLPYEGEAQIEGSGPDPDLSTIAAKDSLTLAPDGSADSSLAVTVTVRDGSGDPMAGIAAGDVVLYAATTPSGPTAAMTLCVSGGETATLYSTAPTNASGEAFFTLDEVGGCGTITFTAEVEGVAISGGDASLVRSPDFTGDGLVNFWDTFEYIPMLQATVGECGNLNWSEDGIVDFWDTFAYLPFLSSVAACP